MNPITIGIFVFACTFGSALAGLWLRAVLPQHHLDGESQATVKVGIGLIALPCNPDVINKNGVTYYQCGQTYYMQAYGSAGPIYMPVPPPG